MYFRTIYDEIKSWRVRQKEGAVAKQQRWKGGKIGLGDKSEDDYNLPNIIYEMCGVLAQ